MSIKCKIEIECIEDEDGLNFSVSRQGKNVSLPIYFMLLEYAKNELIIAMAEKRHSGISQEMRAMQTEAEMG